MPVLLPALSHHRFRRLFRFSALCCLFSSVLANAATPQASCAATAATEFALSRTAYQEKLAGFWLGLSIANWTGLVTEMDKIGGAGPAGRFYTRADWGKADEPSIWGQGVPSDLSPTINWVLRSPGQVWGSDDDSDIEYIYLQLMLQSPNPLLSGAQIRAGWMAYIYRDDNTPHRTKEGKPENFLWVSNQQALGVQSASLKKRTPAYWCPMNCHFNLFFARRFYSN